MEGFEDENKDIIKEQNKKITFKGSKIIKNSELIKTVNYSVKFSKL